MPIPDAPSTITIADLPGQTIPEGYTLLDVREDDEWEAGHAPGAVHIPLGELTERADELGDDDILVICRTGGRSARAAQWLNQSGYDAWNVDGGMTGWAAAGREIVASDGSVPEIM
ncbi:rhodanese-like domain-containing protein [Georgenia sp. Z1491]|uniref:rhodanese-like domain-containing protein n=1 Tax=Georgenia sp. Z1491 TaxID=3416707 RepID=UPI003CF2E309